ncbi:MAG TPA: diguanylate cyclase [Gemmatimonadales bacterium]|nr:diguanylate cyclase [Gemmatimonadales bacterium]
MTEPAAKRISTSVWEGAVSSALSRARLTGIKNQLVAFTITATLLPGLATAWISYTQNRRSLIEKISQELVSAASQAAREVDLWTKGRLYELRVFGSSYEVSENLDRMQRGQGSQARVRLRDYLESVNERVEDYDELLVVDPSGRAVASSESQPGAIRLPENWQRRLRTDEVVVGDPYRDHDGVTRLAIAVPVIAPSGRFFGGIVARTNLKSMSQGLAGLKPGGSGHISIVDRSGVVIAANVEADSMLPAAAAGRLRAAGDTAVEYRDARGVPVLGSLVEVPQVGWSVVAAIPRAVAYAQVTRLRNVTLLLLAALLVLVGALAYGLGALMVRPLNRLTRGAAQVAGGDLAVDLPVTASGEIGYLTRVFNDMVVRLRESRRELERLSVTDILTGLSNRRHLLTALDQEIRRSARHERPCTVLMIDVDHFKRYNDTYGHLAGDEVLARVGKLLKEAVRVLDVPARYGGEEFAVVLSETDLEGGAEVAERIRTRVAQEQFTVEGGSASVTLSIGVASFPDQGETAQALLSAADAALYQAKKKGRNCVVTASPPTEQKPRRSRGTISRS